MLKREFTFGESRQREHMKMVLELLLLRTHADSFVETTQAMAGRARYSDINSQYHVQMFSKHDKDD